MAKLNDEQITDRLTKLGNWSKSANDEISRTFLLSGFAQALVFVNAVGLLAEAAQHHPDITIQWRRVTLLLTTHDEGGLTDKDLDLAAQIDRLPLI